MTVNLKRSNVEASHRLFLDRLNTDAQPLLQPDKIDEGPGDEYDYGGVGDTGNLGVGFDCSGLDFVVIACALWGFAYFVGKGYQRMGTTETFPGPFPGFRKVSQQECIASPSPIKVMIGHYGGGENSHMACIIDGWHMESNGDYGICGGKNWDTPAVRKIITPIDSGYWNDWWVYDGGIDEDTDWRQPMGYPLVLDYSAGPGRGPDGHVSGASLKAAGVAGVCRYLFGAGTSLQYKQLTRAEADDLKANGRDIVSNFEQGTQNMLGGDKQGTIDVQRAVDVHQAAGGPDVPRIYFSADWDATPEQQSPINDYLGACAAVLGKENTGIYGGYWPVKRALDAGACGLAWQAEAWSGGNIDSRINLLQRNGLGYRMVDGVQCDINEAHTDDYGQWGHVDIVTSPPPIHDLPPSDPFLVWLKQASDRQLLEWMVEQMGPGNPAWVNKGTYLRDRVFGIAQGQPVPAVVNNTTK